MYILYHLLPANGVSIGAYICMGNTSFANYTAWKWRLKKQNHDLAPKLVAYTLWRRVSATWAIDVAMILFVSLSSYVVSETCTSFTPTCITLTDNTMGSFKVYTWCTAIKWRVNVVDSLSDVSNHCLHVSTPSKFRFQHRPRPFNLYVRICPTDLYTQTKKGSLIPHCFYNLHTILYLPP